ncbi:hypothetical protein MKX08_007054 [Trichoderma sp. CBMAI-0020]|nr:hypothetical protein MKX08_007054 [Trichoderma sp. CBMAI-0020]
MQWNSGTRLLKMHIYQYQCVPPLYLVPPTLNTANRFTQQKGPQNDAPRDSARTFPAANACKWSPSDPDLCNMRVFPGRSQPMGARGSIADHCDKPPAIRPMAATDPFSSYD